MLVVFMWFWFVWLHACQIWEEGVWSGNEEEYNSSVGEWGWENLDTNYDDQRNWENFKEK